MREPRPRAMLGRAVSADMRTAIRAELARLVGAEHVLDAPPSSPYNLDCSRRRGVEGRAEAVVLPGDPSEVAAVLAWCYERDVSIVPRGGGTRAGRRRRAARTAASCSLERLAAVRELRPGAVADAARGGRAHERRPAPRARERALFPPDPGAAEQSQIGGNIATNAGGPHAFKYGTTGAWVSGLEAVAGARRAGRRSAARLRKDVAGYDLKSLLIGSEGTLGVITAALADAAAGARGRRCRWSPPTRPREGCAAIDARLGGRAAPGGARVPRRRRARAARPASCPAACPAAPASW